MKGILGGDNGKGRRAAGAAVEIVEAGTDGDYVAGRALIEEYARNLGVEACLQGFNHEITNLRTLYGPPGGCLLLARAAGEFVGSVALRTHAETICELKRLYVQAPHRGCGTGRALAQKAVARARELGYAAVVLETLETMAEARRLYASLGFAATGEQLPNSSSGVRHMRLDLGMSREP